MFPVLVRKPRPSVHKKSAVLTTGFLLIQHSDCKTPFTRANLLHCDILSHHEPCSTFGSKPWFCIFDGASEGEGKRVGSVERKRTAGFLCDVCCEITAVSPELTQTAQCESTLKSLLLLAWARYYFWFLFCLLHTLSFEVISNLHIAALYSLISFTSQSYSIHLHTKAESMTSRWSQKPVVPQAGVLKDTSAPSSIL